MALYKIVRKFVYYACPRQRSGEQTIKRSIKVNLTLAQAKAHCKNPQFNSETIDPKTPRAKKIKLQWPESVLIKWFDYYEPYINPHVTERGSRRPYGTVAKKCIAPNCRTSFYIDPKTENFRLCPRHRKEGEGITHRFGYATGYVRPKRSN